MEGRAHASGVTVEYWTEGLGSPSLDGSGPQVYATTLIGRCAGGIARVTAHYPGQEEQDAVVARGVWFSQVLRGASAGDPVVRGYGVDGGRGRRAVLGSLSRASPRHGLWLAARAGVGRWAQEKLTERSLRRSDAWPP